MISNVVIFIIICLVSLAVGIIIGSCIVTNIFSNSKIFGTLMINEELEEDGCYFVWNVDPKDIMDEKIGYIRVKKWDSR